MTKRAVVTGHTSGIGLMVAQWLQEHDWFVIGVARDTIEDPSMDQIQSDLQFRNNRNDVLKELNKYEEIHALINNAGFMDMEESYPQSYDELMAVNLEAPYHLCEGLYAMKKLRAGSSILNVASVSGMKGEPFSPIYAMAKAGVISMTKSLAKKFAERPVYVNSVSPGFVKTNLCPGDTPSSLIDEIPIKCECEAIHMGIAIYNILNTPYMTGSNVVIDGGLIC